MEIINQYFGEFTDTQTKQFARLKDLYIEWNEKINVISRKDIEFLYRNHVLHSLSIAAITGFKPGTQIIDIGTGGGFPGIPLAIYFPEVSFHLVDSIGKKLKIVNAVVEALNIQNITTQHCRVEDIKGRTFDFAVSRAVAPLKNIWQWSKPLIRKGHDNEMANGLICLKGGDLAQEISESNTRPTLYEINSIFKEEYFEEKYVVYVPKK